MPSPPASRWLREVYLYQLADGTPVGDRHHAGWLVASAVAGAALFILGGLALGGL